MADDVDLREVAGSLLVSVRLLVHQVRQLQDVDGKLSIPERSALARLERGGPTTASELAKQEHIRPQSMGATLGGLQERGLIDRRPDPTDGRRILLSVSEAGLAELRDRRNARTERLADALGEFTKAEVRQLLAAVPLIERLAHRV